MTPEAPTPVRQVRPEERVRLARHVVHREFPAQTVILNLEAGRYYGLNRTAGRMLTALDEHATVAAAARAVSERYSEPQDRVQRDLCELCTELLRRGLVELVERT